MQLHEWSPLFTSGKLAGKSVGYLGEYHLSNGDLATSLMEYAYLGWHHAIAHGILTDSFMFIYYILRMIVAHLFMYQMAMLLYFSDYPITIQL